MSIYDRLAEQAKPTELVEQPTSYFSAPEDHLDPKLFTKNDVIRPDVRTRLLSKIRSFWSSRYRDTDSWTRVYIAGSGVSYQWSAARDPGDLDVLLGVDFIGFRRSNADFRFLGDDEIAALLNQELHDGLWPETGDWFGFETTWYVNPGGYDIAALRPYAAYDLTNNRWVVRPDPDAHPAQDPRWEALAEQDRGLAQEIVATYNKSYDEVQGVSNPGLRLNAEITLRTTAARGAHLFDAIHEGRKKAFSATGSGYSDFNEYRYKSAKGHGVLGALREMKVELQAAGLLDEEDKYGVSLPDAHKTLVAAALSRRYRG